MKRFLEHGPHEVIKDSAQSLKRTKHNVFDRDDDSINLEVEKPFHIPDIESTLPQISIDQNAIDEYENSQPKPEDQTLSRLQERKWIRGKTSIYVDAFNLALDTVLQEESILFNDAELELFKHWKNLAFESQFLYVRLFLRKTSAWHRVCSLNYQSDIANLDNAINDLQLMRTLPDNSLDDFDSTFDESQYSFAESSDIITNLHEASTLLKLDELKVIAKDVLVTGRNKQELITNLRKTSKTQTGLKSLLRRTNSEEELEQDKNRDHHFVAKILEETGPCIRLASAPLKLFERVHLVFYRSTEWNEKSLTAIILARLSKKNFPDYIVSRSSNVFESREFLVEYEKSIRLQFTVDNILEFGGKPTHEGYQEILNIFQQIYPRWKYLLDHELGKENSLYKSGEGAYLRRLSPAWVYTRIIHKATTVFAKQKNRIKEHGILTELLQQKLFHHSRRGAWYQRKALLEEHYMADLTDSQSRNADAQSRHWKNIALQTCEDGVQDPLVHVIHHYDLFKRLSKLERACKVPKRLQRDFSHVKLAAPKEVTVYGIQKKSKLTSSASSASSAALASSTRTIWIDPLQEDHDCTVEEMCLSHYRSRGWKGYHCEGRLMRTLFAYLFFDVLFVYVPNVFQTPFQTCPLDLHSDAFYPCRMSEINHRLAEIENGKAGKIIREVWQAHNQKETCIIGLDWGYELHDLLEIVQGFEGRGLAMVCKVLAQDYASRGGGMPDLFLWHPQDKTVKFVEVKSENDRLSDTQRLWIDVLSGAGIRVELCHALSSEIVRS